MSDCYCTWVSVRSHSPHTHRPDLDCPSTAVDKPVDDEGVTMQPALDEFLHPRAVERDPHYFGTRLPTPAEAEAEAQDQLRRRGRLTVEISADTAGIEQRLVAIEDRLDDLERRHRDHPNH